MMLFIGIDPGKSGAIAAVDNEGRYIGQVRLKETEHDIQEWMVLQLGIGGDHFAMLEQVNAMPRQGVSSTFKFGQSYGFCRGLLVAHRLTFETVSPSKWQGEMKCRTKGDKNITKSAAQRLFPTVKVTHANADALLLAEYGRRLWYGRGTNGDRS